MNKDVRKIKTLKLKGCDDETIIVLPTKLSEEKKDLLDYIVNNVNEESSDYGCKPSIVIGHEWRCFKHNEWLHDDICWECRDEESDE